MSCFSFRSCNREKKNNEENVKEVDERGGGEGKEMGFKTEGDGTNSSK